MLNGLHRLRHDAVVGRDHEHDDVRRLRATGTHGSECRVARSVQEGYDATGGLDVVGADVLRDSTRLSGGDLRAPDVVEQRGLAVIHMAHHRDDRRTRLALVLGLFGGALQILLDLVFLQDLGRVTQLLDDEHGGVLVDRLIDRGHDAHVHQNLDDLGRLDGHLLRKLRDGRVLANANFAHHRRSGHLKGMPAL